MADGTLKVGTITTSSGSGTITLGQSGETVTVPSGVTLSGGIANTPAFYAYLGSDQTGLTDAANTKITIDTEVLDTDNCFESYKFTPNVAGKYFIYACINFDGGGTNQIRASDTRIYKNGSSILQSSFNLTENMGRRTSPYVSVVVDANGSTDYFELYGELNTDGGGTWSALGYASSEIRTFFGGYKIIGA